MKGIWRLALAMTCAGLVFGAPSASADTAIWVHGAMPQGAELSLSDVLRRVPEGYTLQQVDYPAGLWPWTGLTSATGSRSIAAGVPKLDSAIRTALGHGKVLVIGESLGSLVVDQELRNLATDPNAPDPAQVRFEVIADPTRPGGLFSYVPIGSFVLLTDQTSQPVAETPYDVAVIKLQYDGVASWPDRPWNIAADLNALAGGIIYHGTDHYGLAAQQIMNNEVPAQDIRTTVNSRGGTTTTSTIQQTPALPHLLEPFFPKFIAAVDTELNQLINQGYSELYPDAGPHLAPGGQLVNSDGTPVDGKSTAVPRRPHPVSKAAQQVKQTTVHAAATGKPRRPGRSPATRSPLQ